MGRMLALPKIGVLAWLATLAGCYALPERHSLSREASGVDAGSEADADWLDGEVALDGGDGGKRDGAANPCHCGDARPICIEATKTCVACTEIESTCAADEVCDVLRGECVECLQNADCKDPSASVCNTMSHACEPCAETSADACSHIEGKHVCFDRTCVQCTKDKLAACVVEQGSKTVQNACHALDHTCTDYELRKTPPCGECVSDAQCMVGHVCVEMAFGGQPIAGKWYCQPVHDGLNCNSKRPYVVLASGKVTIEGESADFCTLRASSCSALSHYVTKSCGLDRDGRPVTLNDAGEPLAPSVKGDNALCGLPGLEDGYCVEAQAGLHLCTVACVALRDCPAAAQACVLSQAHATGSADLCEAQ